VYFEVDGKKIYSAGNLASDIGSKPVIVLLHGAGMDSSVWVYNTRYFSAQGRSVLAIDFPNHGLTKGGFLTSIEAMASWALRCLDALGVNDFSVGGHSMGALVALEIAGLAGRRVKRMALLGAAFPMEVSPALLDAASQDLRSARDMVVLWGHGPDAYKGGNTVAGINIMKSAYRLLERSVPGTLFNDLNACNEYRNGVMAAENVYASTLILSGREDKMTPPQSSMRLLDEIKESSLSIVEKSGHMLLSECPEAVHLKLKEALF
jgi:pimeloyl-ACP methyl ester carboxylesterase